MRGASSAALRLCFLTVLASVPAAPSFAASAAERHPIFEVDPHWPKEMPNGYFMGQIGGLTVDPQDNVWVFSRPRAVIPQLDTPPVPESGVPAPSVVEFSADGRFLQGWGGPFMMSDAERAGFDWPVQEHGITVDDKGNVWLCGNGRDAKNNKDDNQCLKFTNNGKFIMQVGKSGASKGSLDMENFNHASQPVFWKPTNEVFVSDGYVNRRVVVMDADSGKFKRIWGAYGNKPDDAASKVRQYDPPPQQFNLAHALTISKDGIVYLSDRNNNRVQAFTLDGKFLKEGFVSKSTPMVGFGTIFSATLSGDKDQKYLYVCDGHVQKIRVLDRQTLMEIPGSAFGHVGPYTGQFMGLHVIATDSKGNLYTGDGRDGRVEKFVFKGMSK